MQSCGSVICCSEYSAARNAMGMRHDLEDKLWFAMLWHGTWPHGCSAECNALGLTGDPGVMLTVFSGLGT